MSRLCVQPCWSPRVAHLPSQEDQGGVGTPPPLPCIVRNLDCGDIGTSTRQDDDNVNLRGDGGTSCTQSMRALGQGCALRTQYGGLMGCGCRSLSTDAPLAPFCDVGHIVIVLHRHRCHIASFAADVQVLPKLMIIAVILLCLSGVFVFNIGGSSGGRGGRGGLLSHLCCCLDRGGQQEEEAAHCPA